ncbi:MAG: protein-glutamate O-methyltransferase CheR [Bacteroidetes bacterium]|nr:MAG: protein-glutamate O-methyltransferase CheR [Bacteroidota bacterium]
MLPEALPEIADRDLERFFQIMLQFGYDFRGYAPASLKRRLGTVLKRYGLKELQALNQRLLAQPEYGERLISEITVSTTELFRDPSAWIAFRLQVLPLFAQTLHLRVWHVGASTGEEVLSMAILLKETGLYERTHLYATDIDTHSLAQAQRARYPLRLKNLYQQNFAAVLPGVPWERYVREEGSDLVFDPALLERVRFLKHNIVSEAPFANFEIVVCRNLLIYFTPALQDRVVSQLVDSLMPGGILMIGTKESLFWCAAAKRLTPVNELERIYRRRSV